MGVLGAVGNIPWLNAGSGPPPAAIKEFKTDAMVCQGLSRACVLRHTHSVLERLPCLMPHGPPQLDAQVVSVVIRVPVYVCVYV